MDKKLNQINFHVFFEICTMLSGIHFLAQFLSLCIYSIRVAGSDYYGEVSGLQLIGNIIYSILPTFFTFVTILGITLLYYQLVPKKEKDKLAETEAELNDAKAELQRMKLDMSSMDISEDSTKDVIETIKEGAEEVKAIPEYNLKMKKAELLEIADSLNVKVNKSAKKEDIIKALDESLK